MISLMAPPNVVSESHFSMSQVSAIVGTSDTDGDADDALDGAADGTGDIVGEGDSVGSL